MTVRKFNIKKGFTLIELLVVIAILGILAVGLIAVIDPGDKIALSNDNSVVSSISQFGRANDNYAANHSNTYVEGSDVDTALTALKAEGESKVGSYTPPTGYVADYAVSDDAGDPCTSAAANCTKYAFWVTGLSSKKYNSGTPANNIYVWANGTGCLTSAAPTATFTCP